MSLKSLEIDSSYSTDGGNNLLYSFYNPVLEEATSYDRVTGFFSPRVFAIAARGFRKCLKNRCKIRIITSVFVDDETYEALGEGSKLSEASDAIENFDIDSLHDDLDYNYLRLFVKLYQEGLLELRVAAIRNGNGIFHEKIGIITDGYGDALSFSGSNNETASGWINNIEEFKVFKSWIPGQDEYFVTDRNKFDRYWNNNCSRFKVMSLDEAEKGSLIKRTGTSDITIEEICEKIERNEVFSSGFEEKKTRKKELRLYQKAAIEHWKKKGFKTIFEMATGTGKTFTTVSALRAFLNEKKRIHCIIGVPLITLLIQWRDELQTEFGDDIKIIVASGSVQKDWKEQIKKLQINSLMSIDENFAILVPYVTFGNSEFSTGIENLGYKDMIFLADEMHNLVTERCISALNENIYAYRLGLSATPVRLWRPEESRQVMSFFGEDPYVFTLERAIKEEFLVPYDYHIYPVYLTASEFEDYCALSKEIGHHSAIDEASNDGNDYSKKLMLKRARIKKNAENKLLVLGGIIDEMRNRHVFDRSLIYSDNEDYLEKIQKMLQEKNIITSKYTGHESLDERLEITESLRNKNISAIVAIKCLDEGVDIPCARNAFFVSSNTDPREYVQRLGRVLRLDKESEKKRSMIYDFMVLPPKDISFETIEERRVARNLVRNEMIRVKYFYNLANNKEDAMEDAQNIVNELGMTFTEDELELNNKQEDEYGDN